MLEKTDERVPPAAILMAMTLGVESVRAHLEQCDKTDRITWLNSVHDGTEKVASGHLFVIESTPHLYIMTRQPCRWRLKSQAIHPLIVDGVQ